MVFLQSQKLELHAARVGWPRNLPQTEEAEAESSESSCAHDTTSTLWVQYNSLRRRSCAC